MQRDATAEVAALDRIARHYAHPAGFDAALRRNFLTLRHLPRTGRDNLRARAFIRLMAWGNQQHHLLVTVGWLAEGQQVDEPISLHEYETDLLPAARQLRSVTRRLACLAPCWREVLRVRSERETDNPNDWTEAGALPGITAALNQIRGASQLLSSAP